MGGQVGQQSQLRRGQAHRPGAGRPRARLDAGAQLACVVDQRAHVRPELEHLLGLGEHRPGGACVGEREMGARELEPDRDGQPRNAVVEQRPQPMGARERRAGVLGSALVECDARGRHMHERARGVVAEARRVDVRLCRLRVLSPPRASHRAWPRGARAAPGRSRRRRPSRTQARTRSRPGGRPSQLPSSRAAHARRLGPRTRPASNRSPAIAEPARGRRRRGPARHRSGIRPARRWATHGSIVALPSESGIRDVAPSASASQRSASAGRPVSSRTHPPMTASAGYCASSSSPNHPSHSSNVSLRPS